MISEETSKKLGKELTAQHPLAVHGMATSSTKISAGFHITSSTVTAVKSDGCQLRVTLCRGDLCEMKQSFYKFRTPLTEGSTSALEERIRSEVVPDVCAPKPLWLITDPLAFLILVVCSLLAYGTYIGIDGITDALLKAPKLEKTIGLVFGTSRNFAYAVCGAFWFSIVAHGIEASLVVYYATTVLKMGVVSTSIWAILVFSVGYPIFNRFQTLVAIERGHSKSK